MKKAPILLIAAVLITVIALALTYYFFYHQQDPPDEQTYAGFPLLYHTPEEYQEYILTLYGEMPLADLLELTLETLDPSRIEMQLALLLRKDDTLPLLKTQLQTADDEGKFKLLMLIQSHLRWKETTPEISALLNNPGVSEEVRGRAATALALFQKKEEIPAIKDLLQTSRDPVVQHWTAISLGYLGDTEACTILETLFLQDDSPYALQDDSPYIHITAAGVLGMLGSTAGEELMLRLSDHERFDVRFRVAEALSYIGTPAAMLKLRDMVDSDPSPAVRYMAAEYLGRAELDALERSAALTQLKKILTAEDAPLWAIVYLIDYFAPEAEAFLRQLSLAPGNHRHAATVAILQLNAETCILPYVRRPLK